MSTEFLLDIPISSFTNIYTSDLLRAKQTLEISTAFEYLKYKQDNDLREIHHGNKEGLFFDG